MTCVERFKVPPTKLTHGLVPKVRDRKIRYELITDVVQGRWASFTRSPNTLLAEEGLGIRGEPLYCFVMRTERAFGQVVFVFADTGADDSSGDGGATPFDSGGLWHDHIRTEPRLRPDERPEFFRRATIPLGDWQHTFESYVQDNYPSWQEYVLGRRPVHGTPPIVLGRPNTARAWTWEVRVPGDLIARRLELTGGSMPRADHSRYLSWLWDESPVEDRDAARIQRWLADNMILSDKGQSPSDLMESALLSGTT